MMLKFEQRKVLLCDSFEFGGVENDLAGQPHVTLLPALDESELDSSMDFALKAIALGCKEFCLLGRFSSKLEDALDAVLEASDRFDVVTTSFLDENEALEYFLFAAGGAEAGVTLVAAIERHAELVHALVSLIGSPSSSS